MVLCLVAGLAFGFPALFSREFKLARIFFNSASTRGVVAGGASAGGASCFNFLILVLSIITSCSSNALPPKIPSAKSGDPNISDLLTS